MAKVGLFLAGQGKGLSLFLTMLLGAFSPQAHGLTFWIQISAKASDFLHNDLTNSVPSLVMIALVSLLICIVNFGVGAFLGGRGHWQEASQSLGQKNLSFVIWVALTFINPLVAMGPTFYILFHHMYNSWMLYRFEKGRRAV